jgi:heat shock protein HslJ
MGPPPDRPISDPLLRPEGAERDARGRPVRAPLGNSIRTFAVLVLLVAVGVSIWWIRRPDDLLASIGGREWTITDVDGVPATNGIGTASTFVLDGNGEIRAPAGCNVASGQWTYDEQSSELTLDWLTRTQIDCDDAWPRTFLPEGGEVELDGTVMRITTDTGEVRAVSLGDHATADIDRFAGTWQSGGRQIDIGRRGRFQIDSCDGSWAAVDEESSIDESSIEVRFEGLQRDECGLAPMWRDETPVVPVIDDGVLYLRRDRAVFPLDRAIVRLDPIE